MKRRVAVMLLAAAMVLTACGSGSGSTESSTTTQEEAATTEETTEATTEASTESEEASTEETTEVSSEPTESEIRMAYAALIKALAGEQDGSYFLVDLEEDGLPELIETSGTDNGVTLWYYNRESKTEESLAENGALYWIPGSGDVILKIPEESSDSDTEAYTLEKYHLENGNIKAQETGSMETNTREGTQVLTVDDSEVDASDFLSVFDFDHALSPSQGLDITLMREILKANGTLTESDDASVYLDYMKSETEDSSGDAYTDYEYDLFDLDGDGTRELFEYVPQQGTNIFTVIDGELVQLHESVGSTEYCSPDTTRDILYSQIPMLHDWNYSVTQALTLRGGCVYQAGVQAKYWPADEGEEESNPGYAEATYINDVQDTDGSGRDFEELIYALAGDTVRSEDEETEIVSRTEMLSALKKETGDTSADTADVESWVLDSYAMTLDGLLEGKVFLGDGQGVSENVEDFQYQLLDLDGDGRPELLVGGQDSFDFFLPEEGYAGWSPAPASTNTAWDSETKEIYFEDVASAYDATDIGYRLDGEELVYIESVTYFDDGQGGYTDGMYQTPEGAELFDPEDPPEEVETFESMENDIPEDAWKDLTEENIIEDFGSLPDEIVVDQGISIKSLWEDVGDVEATRSALLAEDMTSWQKSYSMALNGILEGHIYYYLDYMGLGDSSGSSLVFQLLDLNADGTPELLVKDLYGNSYGEWVVFRPVDGYAAETVTGGLLMYAPSKGICMYIGNEVATDITWGYELGIFDGSGFQATDYIMESPDQEPHWQYVKTTTGEVTDLGSAEAFDALHQQWVTDMESMGNTLEDSYMELTRENITSALGACLEPEYAE